MSVISMPASVGLEVTEGENMPSLGVIVDVDVGTGAITQRQPTETELRALLGGRGFVAHALLDHGGDRVDPLAPDNPLLLFTGLLTGSRAPASSRVHLGARSPLTGLSGSSSVGGELGQALRRNGLFGLTLHGRAKHPVYVLVTGGEVTLHDARDLWNRDTLATAQVLQDTYPKAATLLVGPAGEHLAAIACLVTGNGHAAGRTGMGAVLGAKLVKAIVVDNSARSVSATASAGDRDQENGERGAVKRYLQRIIAAPAFQEYRQFGSSTAVSWCNDEGILGTRNFAAPRFAGADATDGSTLERWVTRTKGCPGCPVHCKAEMRFASSRFGEFTGERPDFEPLVAWGAKVGVDDPQAVVALHNFCDRMGLDSVSAGAAAAFAIDLFEHGVIDKTDTEGLELRWGAVEALQTLIERMASGQGFGALLASGVRRAAAVIGRGAERYAYHVKGLEIPAYDPRGAFGAGLGYAISNRGADFTSVYARQEFDITPELGQRLYGDEGAGDPTSTAGKAAMVRRSMIVSAALDSLGLCKIPALTLLNDYELDGEAELTRELTGLDLSATDLLLAGERIVNLERLFNAKAGADVTLDELPPLFVEQPLTEGPAAGVTVQLAPMRDEFYRLMGWTATGLPTRETLSRLGLADYAAELAQPGAQRASQSPEPAESTPLKETPA